MCADTSFFSLDEERIESLQSAMAESQAGLDAEIDNLRKENARLVDGN